MKPIRQRLGWKLFISYLVIILVGIAALAITAEIQVPTAFNRHLSQMGGMMGGTGGGMMADLTTSFDRAVGEILLVSAAAAFLSAVVISTFVTRRIVRPIQEMKRASGRIADGRFDERVEVTGEDELGELGRAFNRMANRLAQTEERRRQLIGDVAHELRTPLSSLMSVVEGLQDGVLPPDARTIASVQKELGRLQRLVDDLEELSRAEAGQIPLVLERAEVAVFTTPAVERLASQFEEKGVALEVALPADLPPVRVDPARMTQVVLNLLGNALQYTPAGGRVTLSAAAGPDQLTLAIADTGIGIPAAYLPHIFERFYRAEKSRLRSHDGRGFGLGLSIAYWIVHSHGGRIEVDSKEGQGTTFNVWLPLTDGDCAEPPLD